MLEKTLDDKEEVTIEELLENEYLKKDPVRKYQFEDYNKSLCLSNMYPEMGPENSIIVAPGEGKISQSIHHVCHTFFCPVSCHCSTFPETILHKPLHFWHWFSSQHRTLILIFLVLLNSAWARHWARPDRTGS